MKDTRWIDEFRPYGHRTYEFDFKAFMKSEGLTVEGLASVLVYSVPGVLGMLHRGTVKKSTFEKLIKSFGRKVDRYLGKKIVRKKRTT